MVKLNQKFSVLATDDQIKKTIVSLEQNGFNVTLTENKSKAKKKVLEILPPGAQVFALTSVTLTTLGILKDINESGKYTSVRSKLMTLDRTTQAREMAKLGAAPDWVVGSVHAITEDGRLLIASNTGSQLASSAYGAGNVLFVAGTQKLVKDTEAGIERIYEYSFPLENERALKAYGTGSGVNKILIINKEIRKDRIHIILVKEKLGF